MMSDASAEKHSDPLSPFNEAYACFVKTREEAAHKLLIAVTEAQHQHRPDKTAMEDPEAAKELPHSYSEAIRSAWTDSQVAFQAAHDEFVVRFGKIWTKMDSALLDPCGMATVSNGLATVAAETAADIGNLGLFYHTGVIPPEDVLTPPAE